MRRTCSLVAGLLLAGGLGLPAAGAADAPDAGREHVLRVCAGCHCLEFYVSPRSRKAWELTVANMRVYAQNGAAPFSEADAERVVDYMASCFDEYSNLEPSKHFAPAPDPAPAQTAGPSAASPQPAAPPAPAPLPPPPAVERPAPAASALAETVSPPPDRPLAARISPDAPPALRARLAHPPWKPSRALKRAAETGGYLAVACTLTLLVSGHSRRRLRRRFRPLHIVAALGLFLGLATHALIYLAQYGSPPVLWYGFGVASFLVLVLAQLQGLARKRFGRVFLRLHVAAGYGGLALALCHWAWAWL